MIKGLENENSIHPVSLAASLDRICGALFRYGFSELADMSLNLFLFFVIIAAMLPILCEKDD